MLPTNVISPRRENTRHPHLDHGYTVTSYSSQGQTAERVLIHIITNLAAKDLLNSRMVEAAGVEPASENVTGQETTCLFRFMPRALGVAA